MQGGLSYTPNNLQLKIHNENNNKITVVNRTTYYIIHT